MADSKIATAAALAVLCRELREIAERKREVTGTGIRARARATMERLEWLVVELGEEVAGREANGPED